MAIVRLAYKLSEGANYIDLAHGLSLTERRLIHQKQVFTIMGGYLVDNSSNSLIKISTAPNNFYTRNAVTRGFRAWKKSRAKALEASGDNADDLVAKYSDFKVYLDQSNSNYRKPVSANSTEHTGNEWMYSTITPEQGPAQAFMIVGPHQAGARYSLSKGWLETRNTIRNNEPSMPDLNSDGTSDVDVDFIATMFQDTTEDTQRLARINDENNSTPFPVGSLFTCQEAYDAAEPRNLQLQFIQHSSGLNETNSPVPGFQALCGLIRVDVTNSVDTANPILIVDVETKGWNF